MRIADADFHAKRHLGPLSFHGFVRRSQAELKHRASLMAGPRDANLTLFNLLHCLQNNNHQKNGQPA